MTTDHHHSAIREDSRDRYEESLITAVDFDGMIPATLWSTLCRRARLVYGRAWRVRLHDDFEAMRDE